MTEPSSNDDERSRGPRSRRGRRGAAPELRDGLPRSSTPSPRLQQVAAFAAGTGPVAIDAERASGYRYGPGLPHPAAPRGLGTALVDPIAFGSMDARRRTPRRHRVDHPRRQPGPALPCRDRARPPRCSTPSSPDACSATRGSGSPRWSRSARLPMRRSTRRSTGRATAARAWLRYAALDVEVLVELQGASSSTSCSSRQGGVGRQESSPARPRAADPRRAMAAYVGPAPRTRPPGPRRACE